LIDFRISAIQHGRSADILLLVHIALSKSFRRCLACEIISPFVRFRFFFVAQKPYSGLGHLIVEVSRSHTIRHITQPVGLLWTSDESVTYTTHNKHRRLTPIASARFEPAIPNIKPPQTYTCECTDPRIGEDSL
jgi:hypothetical protein